MGISCQTLNKIVLLLPTVTISCHVLTSRLLLLASVAGCGASLLSQPPSSTSWLYAPWCPACQQIEAAWENFAKESDHLDITVGKVDVTQEPGTQGIIVITVCLLLSAMDGVFRRYRGSRTSEDLQGYILERKWEAVEPVAGWKSPSSIIPDPLMCEQFIFQAYSVLDIFKICTF
uniref:Thioredoxin domain-containing protein n=1 Tax=Gopherus evgoodei TaxID=1825980 RepID=A0A8C4Y4V3_9SAUR